MCYGTTSDHKHVCVAVMTERNRIPMRGSCLVSPIYNIRSSDGCVVRPRCERVTDFLPMPLRLFSSVLTKNRCTQTEENFSCVEHGAEQHTEEIVEQNLQQNVELGNAQGIEQNIESTIENNLGQNIEPIIENNFGQNIECSNNLNTQSHILLRDLPSTSSGIYTAESFACVSNKVQATTNDQAVLSNPVCICMLTNEYLYLSNVCVFS